MMNSGISHKITQLASCGTEAPILSDKPQSRTFIILFITFILSYFIIGTQAQFGPEDFLRSFRLEDSVTGKNGCLHPAKGKRRSVSEVVQGPAEGPGMET